MFSKRHYEFIAKMLVRMIKDIEGESMDPFAGDIIINEAVESFRRDNSRFNAEKFLDYVNLLRHA